jgi:hypothetical protein
MKTTLVLIFVAAMVSGCAIVPVGYSDGRGDYYGERAYNRDDGRYPDQHNDTYRRSGSYGDNRNYDGHDH